MAEYRGFLAFFLFVFLVLVVLVFVLNVFLLLIPVVIVAAIISWLLSLILKKKHQPVVRVYVKKF